MIIRALKLRIKNEEQRIKSYIEHDLCESLNLYYRQSQQAQEQYNFMHQQKNPIKLILLGFFLLYKH